MRMRWGKYAILILAAFAASSATSAPTRLEQRTAGSEPDPVAQIEAEMTAFGAWLTRATHIELRVQQQLAGLYPALQRAQASGGSPSARAREMRAFIQTALAEMAAADAELGALELPRLEAIPLADDLRPATLVAQIRRLNSDIRAVFTGLLPLLDSPDYGSAEFMGRTRQLYANMALIFESQVVLLRAQQAATQRDDSAWEVLSFEITLVRAAHRIFRVYDPFQPRTDRALPDELVALANELDGN